MLKFNKYHKKMKYQEYHKKMKPCLSADRYHEYHEQYGFTLVEFLVVVGVFIAVGIFSFSGFQNSQAQARDLVRKENLKLISQALEVYFGEHNSYPLSEDGKIKSCNTDKVCSKSEEANPCSWKQSDQERQFCDENYIVYLERVPTDPNEETPFCYISDSKSYKLYAKLQNIKDAECFNHDKSGNCLAVDCNNQSGYTFGISSSDQKLY